jgi:hypothetical protein
MKQHVQYTNALKSSHKLASQTLGLQERAIPRLMGGELVPEKAKKSYKSHEFSIVNHCSRYCQNMISKNVIPS